MATANFSINPEDGWVAVTSAGVNFIRIRGYPDSQPFYVTSNPTAPASTVRGYRVDCGEDFYVNVPVTDNFYVRTTNPKPDIDFRVDVFFVLTTP